MQQTRAPVEGGAAADAQYQFPRAVIERRADQFAGTAGIRLQRILVPGVEQTQARGVGQLDHGQPPRLHQTESRLHRSTERVVDLNPPRQRTEVSAEQFRRAVAPVAHRPSRPAAAKGARIQTAPDGVRGSNGAQAVFV